MSAQHQTNQNDSQISGIITRIERLEEHAKNNNYEVVMTHINRLYEKTDKDYQELDKKIDLLRAENEKDHQRFEKRFDKIDERFDELATQNQKFEEKMDMKFEKMDMKFEKMDKKFEKMDMKFNEKFKEVDGNMVKLRKEIRGDMRFMMGFTVFIITIWTAVQHLLF